MFTVFWQDDEGAHQARLGASMTSIGRAPEATLRLADRSVSRRHAVLCEESGQWVLRDLDSQNGLCVEGRAVREHVVRDGDTVVLGDVSLRFVQAVKDSIYLNETANSPTASYQPELSPGSIILPAAAVAGRGGSPSSMPSRGAFASEMAGALGSLTAVAKDLIEADSVERLFDRILSLILEHTPAENVFLLLHEPEINQLVPKAMRSRDGGQPASAISRDIALRVFAQRESILTLDALDDPRFQSESIISQNIRSVMCVPLLTRDSTLGVVFVDSTTRRVALYEHHLHFLTLIGNIAAVAIEQARLRQKVEREHAIRERLTRYQSPNLVERLLAESGPGLALAPMERSVSVLFADIVSFSTRAERTVPSEVALLLNSVFSELVDTIFAHDGTLDKFLGDGIMAVFGAPNDLPDHARRAVSCALAMQRLLAARNARRQDAEPIRLRIGINSGAAVAGDIGSDRRVEYTVIGNTVNVAARLQAFVAQPGDVVIGPATREALGDSPPTEALGPQTLKGIREAVLAFRVLGGASDPGNAAVPPPDQRDADPAARP